MLKSMLPVAPTVLRRFSSEQRLAVYVPVPPGRGDSTPMAVTLTVLGADGTPVFESAAVPATTAASAGATMYGARVDVPLDGFAAGAYLLSVTVGGKAAGAPISFFVEARRPQQSWGLSGGQTQPRGSS